MIKTDIVRFRLDGKLLRYGTITKERGDLVFLARKFPRGDKEKNIDSFDRAKHGKDEEGWYESLEIIVVSKDTFKPTPMVLDTHYGFYVPEKENVS